jgi:pimeloyl-ACP methyl ester carboxylesterase
MVSTRKEGPGVVSARKARRGMATFDHSLWHLRVRVRVRVADVVVGMVREQAMIAQVVAASGVQPADLRDWFATVGNHYNEFSFTGFDEAIDHAERLIERLVDTKQRPVDILLGFSQGADLAILLAARQLAGKSAKPLLPNLRGLVLLETDRAWLALDPSTSGLPSRCFLAAG